MSVGQRALSMLAIALACSALALAGATAGFGAGADSGGHVAATLNLHRVRWRDITLPGAACDATRPIQLHNGEALVTPIPSRWAADIFRPKDGVTVGAGLPIYGDLLGGRADVAAINVSCNNGSGTADGALLYSLVIFRARGQHLSVVGVLKPLVQPPEVPATLIGISIHRGSITANEAFYGPEDATCCSTGRATTTWAYSHGTLRPGTPVITKPATR
jgi:hypothetical protein